MSGFVPSLIFGLLGVGLLTIFAIFSPDERTAIYGPPIVLGFAIIVASLVVAAAYVYKKEKYSFLGQYSTTTPVEEGVKRSPGAPTGSPPEGGETGQDGRSRPGGRKSRWPAVE